MAGRAKFFCFHGAFAVKADAEAKERMIRRRARKLPGCKSDPFIRPVKIAGRRRYLVVTERDKMPGR